MRSARARKADIIERAVALLSECYQCRSVPASTAPASAWRRAFAAVVRFARRWTGR